MPLPNTPNAPWPPKASGPEYLKMAEWSAWYSGDPARLRDFYALNDGGNRRQGFWRRMAQKPVQGQVSEFHVPAASDLASVSAGLLFGEEPSIRIADAFTQGSNGAAVKTQERLEELIEYGGIYNRLIEGAESSAAISGVYLHPAWSQEVADHPVIGITQADNAIPTFVYGMLQTVLFWRVVAQDGDVVDRHLELHERVPGGNAHILHGLYRGTPGMIGTRLTDEELFAAIGLDPEVTLPFPELDVTYVPNIRPNRLWRNSGLGVSDYAGSESVLDAIDETYSSWMRDVRLAKARILVPADYLDSNSEFDVDREAFVPMDIDVQTIDRAAMIANQFQIRAEDHQKTIVHLLERVISNAGYTLETFGLGVSGTPARYRREPKSAITMNRRSHWWQPAIARVVYQLLQVDADVFESGIEPMKPEVAISPSMIDDPAELARTLGALHDAMAMSVRERVTMLHPTWSKDRIEAEVKDIIKEEGIGAKPPAPKPVVAPAPGQPASGTPTPAPAPGQAPPPPPAKG